MVTCQVCQQFCITRGWLHMQRKKHWQSTSTLVVSGVVFIRMSIRRALKVKELILSWFHSKKVPNRSDFCHFCHFLYRFKPTSLHILLPSPRCHYNFDFSSSCSFSTRFVRELTNSTEKRITFEIRFGTTFLLRFVSNLDDPHCNIVSSYKFLTYNNHLHISNIHSHHYCLSLSLAAIEMNMAHHGTISTTRWRPGFCAFFLHLGAGRRFWEQNSNPTWHK